MNLIKERNVNPKALLWLLMIFVFPAMSQPRWQRKAPPKPAPLALFHATMTANLPTTETLKKGDFLYEVSHRFLPAVKEGYDAYWGIDGPARIRTALAYGIADGVMITLGRSNFQDNLDLRIKTRLFELRNTTLPTVFAARVGISVNTEVPESLNRGKFDGDNWQYYAQFIANTMVMNGKLGIGLVPSYLYNSSIYTIEKQYTFSMGSYLQYYFNNMWSVWIESNAIVSGYQGFIAPEEYGGKSHNHFAMGLDIETGGHFFHLLLTNNSRLNPSQFIVGADKSADTDNWRFGFGITRHL
jgi:hypothetical protein